MESDVFKSHLFKVSCPENGRNDKCSRLICNEHAKQFELEDGTIIYRCADCAYPEVIYLNGEGEKMFTPMLRPAKNLYDLAYKKDLCKCSCCDRYFAVKLGESKPKLCSFCADAMKRKEENAEKLYKKYADMFPITWRIKHAKDEKLCYEDDEILLFIVADTRYIFDKVDVDEFGFIGTPHVNTKSV